MTIRTRREKHRVVRGRAVVDVREVVCDAKGCHPRAQSVPEDKAEAEAFLRMIGWRAERGGRHSCPFCAGGTHLEKLKAVFEGRGKDVLS